MPLPMASSHETQQRTQIRHVIAVASGKGGVGKSCIAVNLALSWKERGYRVGLLDADIYGPSLRRMLPEERMARQEENLLFPAQSHGISLLSMAHFRKDPQPIAVRAPIVNRLLKQFLTGVVWGDLDFLVIDFPPGTGDVQLTIGQLVPLTGVVLVTTPQEVAVQDVRKAWALFSQLRIPILGIVENMSYFIPEGSNEKYSPFGQGGGERFAVEAGIPFLGQVPIDPALSRQSDFGEHPYGKEGFHSTGMKALSQMACLLDSQIRERNQAPLSSQPSVRSWECPSPFQLRLFWDNQEVTEHSARDLQERCPCAGCEELRKADAPPSLASPSFRQIIPIGKYAFQFRFSTGCSNGLFSFESLYSGRRR